MKIADLDLNLFDVSNLFEFNDFVIQKFYVIRFDDGRIMDEYADRKEAKHYYHFYGGKGYGLTIQAACAEFINTDGDVNPAVYAPTMAQAVKRIKQILS